MSECGGHETVAADLLETAGAAPSSTGLSLGVAERGLDRGVVRQAELAGRFSVRDAPGDADGLGCAKGEIKPGDRVVADRAPKTAD